MPLVFPRRARARYLSFFFRSRSPELDLTRGLKGAKIHAFGRVLIVFSRKLTGVMEYRRSERSEIMSKTNEARRNKRAQPLPRAGEGFALVGVAVLREKWRANFPALVPSSLLSCLRSFAAALALRPSFSRARQKGRERATKGGKTRERNYRREGTTATMDTVGVVASGGEADQYFCTRAPSGSGPWHRGALSRTS